VPRLRRGLGGLALGTALASVTFLLAEPYALLDGFLFVSGLAQEGAMARGAADLPYTRQFIGTLPYLYTLRELVVWSLGVPLGALALAGLGWMTWRALCRAGGGGAKAPTTKGLCSDGLSRLQAAATSGDGGRAAEAATTKRLCSDGLLRRGFVVTA